MASRWQTSTSDRLISEDAIANRKSALERAAEKGLPTLEDLDALSDNLQRFFDMLEGLVWIAETVGDCENYAEPIPFPVTVENIAAIGLIVDEANERLDDCRKLSDRLARMFWPNNDVVHRQQAA